MNAYSTAPDLHDEHEDLVRTMRLLPLRERLVRCAAVADRSTAATAKEDGKALQAAPAAADRARPYPHEGDDMPATVRSHWFRADTTDQPCTHAGCGRTPVEHVENVGEWMDPTHWYRPTLRRPARCARCGRRFDQSTHHDGSENRHTWVGRCATTIARRIHRHRSDRNLARLARKDTRR